MNLKKIFERRSERRMHRMLDGILAGERPPNVPEHWIGMPTISSRGYRWDDPESPGNSLRFFPGNPNDPNPLHRIPFVIVVRDGRVRDVNGDIIEDESVVSEALGHT